MQYVTSLIDLVGNTPLVQLRVTEGAQPLVLAKLEYMIRADRSRTGSPSRWSMPPSGRASSSRAAPSSSRPAAIPVSAWPSWPSPGLLCVFVCPDKVSEDKRNVLAAYGARVVVCPTAVEPDDPNSYYSVSDRLVREIEGAWKPDQYSNPNNPASHYETTGPELWRQTDGRITHFVAGIGTGGTISGAGRYLKEVSGGAVQVIGADPEGSVYSGGSGRPYLVEGWARTSGRRPTTRTSAIGSSKCPTPTRSR